jgi:hypothetical protein
MILSRSNSLLLTGSLPWGLVLPQLGLNLRNVISFSKLSSSINFT